MSTTTTTTIPAEEAARPLEELRFHRLLVAVDGSVNADVALSAAVSAARRNHAQVTLIAVAPDVLATSARFAVSAGANPETMQSDADDFAHRVLADALARLPEDVPAHTLFRRGKAGPEIVHAAGEEPYDAIILGARGLGRVGALIGSVSDHVLHHADCAVIVAHAPRTDGSTR